MLCNVEPFLPMFLFRELVLRLKFRLLFKLIFQKRFLSKMAMLNQQSLYQAI